MKVIVIGNGKVGNSLISQLILEGHDITVVDKKLSKLEELNNTSDVLCIHGDGLDLEVLKEAGVENSDLVISVTSSDELNIVCSMLAKSYGAKYVVARIRSKEYAKQRKFIKEDLNIDFAINPEMRTAKEIANQFKIVGDFKIESFSKGFVEILSLDLKDGDSFVGLKLSEIKTNLLVVSVERGEDVFIPSGDFKLESGDKIHIVSSSKNIHNIVDLFVENEKRPKSVSIVGASKLTYYLVQELLKMNIELKIIDSNLETCEKMSELVPSATIIHGDATNQTLLEEEDIFNSDVFIALTGNDEINIILSMYAKNKKINKIITKVNNSTYIDLIKDLGIKNIFSPREVITNKILAYVRSIANIGAISAESVHRLASNKVEALEFKITKDFKYINIPLKDLSLIKDILVAGVVRKGEFIVANGNLSLEIGDMVIVIAVKKKISSLNDVIG